MLDPVSVFTYLVSRGSHQTTVVNDLVSSRHGDDLADEPGKRPKTLFWELMTQEQSDQSIPDCRRFDDSEKHIQQPLTVGQRLDAGIREECNELQDEVLAESWRQVATNRVPNSIQTSRLRYNLLDADFLLAAGCKQLR